MVMFRCMEKARRCSAVVPEHGEPEAFFGVQGATVGVEEFFPMLYEFVEACYELLGVGCWVCEGHVEHVHCVVDKSNPLCGCGDGLVGRGGGESQW